MNKRPFKLPESFLNQLGEFTNGYFLVVLTNEGKFEVYDKADTDADQLAMINFLDIHSDVLQDMLRVQAIEEVHEEDDEDELGDRA